MTKPNFLVIGAQKAGTTWLSENISCHPEVYSPNRKELHYFNKKSNYNKGLDWYLSHFTDAANSNMKAVGEYTPNYLWTSNNRFDDVESDRNSNIPKLIHDEFPKIKLIIILRNPVNRAISAYFWHIMMRRINPQMSILEAMKFNGILSMGFYSVHIKNYLKYFNRNQILVLSFDYDLLKNKEDSIKKIYKFLEIDDTFIPQTLENKSNPRAGSLYMRLNYYSDYLGKAIKFFSRNKIYHTNLFPIKIDERDKHTLSEIYSLYNKDLKKLIGIKLPW